MCTVCGAECIVDIDLSHGSECLSEIRVVLGLFCVEANILEHEDFAVLQSCSLSLSVRTYNVFCHDDFLAEELGKLCCDRRQGELLHVALSSFECLSGRFGLLCLRHSVDLLLLLLVELYNVVEDVVRATHVGAEDDLCVVVYEILNGGQRTDDALCVRDDTVLHRDVEIAADKNVLTGNVDVFYGFLVEVVHFRTLL